MVAQPSSIRPAQAESTASSPAFWERLWERFFMLDSQLQVTRRYDRAGNEYYQIYRPFSGQTKVFSSEQDAIAWLDRQQF